MGFYPHNIQLYRQAFLHKSSVYTTEKGRRINNERLEFLGDAILDAIIGDIVYEHFENKGEGFLTNTRSKIVQRETLNKLAVGIGIDKLIKSSAHLSSHNNYLYGNAFEAFVGAIYLDRGYERCKQFIQHKIIDRYLDLDRLSRKEMNFKSKLIEWGQKNKIMIVFNLLDEVKDEVGNSRFESEILIEGISAGIGHGYSKKESQQSASKKALNKIKDSSFCSRVDEAARLREEAQLPPVSVTDEEVAEEELSAEADSHPLALDD